MAEKRYFWLKLYDDFFTSKRIKKLRSIAGGDTYTIIYLKMMLKAIRSDGYLFFDGLMNDFAEELALDIDEKPDDVKITIQYLLSVGLMETNNDQEYKLTFLENCIGSETASTQRSRECRARKKEQEALQCNDDATLLQQSCSVEKIREDKRKEDIDNIASKKTKQERNIIPPTLEMVQAYCRSRGNNIDAQAFIDFYDSKGWVIGKSRMKDWQAAIRTWERGDRKPKSQHSMSNQHMLTNDIDLDDLEKRLLANQGFK
jgi:predicted phage replisome organizer